MLTFITIYIRDFTDPTGSIALDKWLKLCFYKIVSRCTHSLQITCRSHNHIP